MVQVRGLLLEPQDQAEQKAQDPLHKPQDRQELNQDQQEPSQDQLELNQDQQENLTLHPHLTRHQEAVKEVQAAAGQVVAEATVAEVRQADHPEAADNLSEIHR